MLEETIKVSKEHLGGNDTYFPCLICNIPYGKAVEIQTKFKCVECNRIGACGRIFCDSNKLKENPDFSICSKCGLFTCCDCPDGCNDCDVPLCTKCMEYCQICNEFTCDSHYNSKKEKCSNCCNPKKIKK
jgi:hypothetical protein